MEKRTGKTRSIALVNNKGGVAKTTTAVNLAAGICAEGRRVLLVDLDAQGSASLSLGLNRADLTPGTAEALLAGRPVSQSILRTDVPGLDIMAGSMALASADLVLSDIEGRETILKEILNPVKEQYDYMIFDCPPSLGLVTVNALTAADYYLVPVPPDYLSLEGLVNLFQAVERIKEGIGYAAELLGIVLTLADYRTNANREIIELIREHYGRAVFETEIRVNVRLKEAPSFGKTIYDYDRNSTGAEAYRSITKEVMKRVNR
jgi:chromosome partitioning protein